MFRCRLLFFRMKSAVVCMLIAHVIVMTSSQPTYDPEQQFLQSDCGCQQSDEKLEISVNSLNDQFEAMDSEFAAVNSEIAAMKNELQQLRQQVQQRPEGPGDVTIPPGVSTGPTSESCEP